MGWKPTFTMSALAVACLAAAPGAVAQSRYGDAGSNNASGSGADVSDFFSQMSESTSTAGGSASQPPSGRYGATGTPRVQPLGEPPSATPVPPSPRTTPRRSTQPTNPFSRDTSSTDRNPPRAPSGYSASGGATRSNPLRDSSNSAPPSISRGLPAGSVAGANTAEPTRINNAREAQTHKMLGRMMRAPEGTQLAGTPTRLSTLLQNAGSRQQQAAVTDAYWALTSSMIDYYLSLHEANEASRLRQAVPTYSTSLGEMERALRTRVETSLKSARAAQLNLERMAPVVSRPLPTDVPFCGPYATRFEQIFPAGAPEEARLLAELLPLRLGEIEASVEGVARYEEWVKQVERAGASSRDATGMVRALELLALSRRALVQLVRDYNQKINRYARLATPGEVDTDRLVAMLIRTERFDPVDRSVLASDRLSQPGSSRQAGLDFGASGVGSRR